MLKINELEYLEMPGLHVMLGHDEYPEGHQGGVTIIQNGARVASNGDLRLDRSPGQWDPVPRAHPREVDRARGEIRQAFEYPDPARDRKGFNPVRYPDLHFKYTVRLVPDGAAFRLRVDLERPLPEAWIGRVGLNLELFPGILFGRTWELDGACGPFPLQANGPGRIDADGRYQIAPLGTGRRLTVAPEVERQRLAIELLSPGTLELVDGRGQQTNGWFIVRSLVPAGAAEGAIEWRIAAHALPGFLDDPVIQVSQVGYHPAQPKVAVVALDPDDERRPRASLARVTAAGLQEVRDLAPREWGRFLRYRCLQLDFGDVREPGMYVLRWGDLASSPFQISPAVYDRHVWQPTLEYFLPVQMCHMRVTDRNRVWHGACHLDDARMAPVDHLHFDGYAQGPSTLCGFAPGARVPGLDRGGWHDAGDHDLRVESQIDTVYGLALAREHFGVDHDDTTVDQARGRWSSGGRTGSRTSSSRSSTGSSPCSAAGAPSGGSTAGSSSRIGTSTPGSAIRRTSPTTGRTTAPGRSSRSACPARRTTAGCSPRRTPTARSRRRPASRPRRARCAATTTRSPRGRSAPRRRSGRGRSATRSPPAPRRPSSCCSRRGRRGTRAGSSTTAARSPPT
jgi:hypothetical protein